MYKLYGNLISVCLLLLLFNINFSTYVFAQDSANDKKTVQPNKSSSTEYDETITDTALDLDGSLSCVEIKDSETLNNITEQLTVSVWIKPTAFRNRYTPIIYKGDNRNPDISNRSYTLWLRNDGVIQFASSPKGESERSVYSPTGSIMLNNWYHIAGVIDTQSDSIQLFIDGTKVGQRDYRGQPSIFESVLPLRIGDSHEEEVTLHATFVGQIDDVRVWNIARSDVDIRNDMITELKGDEPGLVGYWKFNKVTDGIISDMSPNRNDGRLIGNPKLAEYIRPISTLTSEEQLAKAAVAYQKLLSDGTNYYEAFHYLAEIYIKTDRFADAEKVYLRALEVDLTQSEHNDAIRNLWKLYTERDAADEFIIILEGLKPRMEGSSVLHELLGDAYKDTGEEEKAKLVYTQWINIREEEVDRQNSAFSYRILAEELLRKNLFPDTALELAEIALEKISGSRYMITVAHALLENEFYDDAFQLINDFLNVGYYQYTERDMFARIVKAGKNIKDEDRYVEMLNNLIDVSELDLPAQLNTIMALAQFYTVNNQHEKAEALVQKTGFMTEDAWMILGPFDNLGRIGFNTEYIPENLPQIDTTVKYGGKNGQVRWQNVPMIS
ncbi:MAG: tetratricopeptide repeat protein [Candidatus Poribacteria bacterium]|nr:tetratricopeptide repeat protein [Candidatus Poribacteria bacterium]